MLNLVIYVYPHLHPLPLPASRDPRHLDILNFISIGQYTINIPEIFQVFLSLTVISMQEDSDYRHICFTNEVTSFTRPC